MQAPTGVAGERGDRIEGRSGRAEQCAPTIARDSGQRPASIAWMNRAFSATPAAATSAHPGRSSRSRGPTGSPARRAPRRSRRASRQRHSARRGGRSRSSFPPATPRARRGARGADRFVIECAIESPPDSAEDLDERPRQVPHRAFRARALSRWVCAQTLPGTTRQPEQSRRAMPSGTGTPTAATRPCSTRMSAVATDGGEIELMMVAPVSASRIAHLPRGRRPGAGLPAVRWPDRASAGLTGGRHRTRTTRPPRQPPWARAPPRRRPSRHTDLRAAGSSITIVSTGHCRGSRMPSSLTAVGSGWPPTVSNASVRA